MESTRIAGVKAFLRRTRTTAQIEALAEASFSSATEEVTITSISGDGTYSSGEVSFPKWLLLQACEEILAEGRVRPLMTYPDARLVRTVT